MSYKYRDRDFHWDEILEQEAKEQMKEMGCDPMFIECALEEMRAGESVTIISNGRVMGVLGGDSNG